VNLDTYDDPAALYLTRGGDVNPYRPLFTGDVFQDVPIPGTQDGGMALILAHPCTFRMSAGRLADRVLVAAVHETAKEGRNAWKRGLLDRMPLPDLDGSGFCAAYFDQTGRALVKDLLGTSRLACLSAVGVNMLQQRLTCHLTRVEVPTYQFNQAFSHTYEEADLLEEWTDTLSQAGWSQAEAASAFESFIRSGEPSLQRKLLDPQQRSSVRRACIQEARRLRSAEDAPGHAES
jgi:hypothetical protein